MHRSSIALSAVFACAALGCDGIIIDPTGVAHEAADRPGSPTGPSAEPVDPATCVPTLPPRRVRKLAPAQYVATLEALLPGTDVPLEAVATGISQGARRYTSDYSDSDATEAHVEALLAMADDLAPAAVAEPGALPACMLEPAIARECIAGFAERAYRRPLEPTEVDALVAFYERERAAGADAARVQLLRALLVSPNVAYVSEIGEPSADRAVLTSVERASVLSYFLSDGPPDAELLAAGLAGELADPAALESHARRLLGSDRTSGGLVRFLDEHFQLSAVLSVERHESYGLTEDVAAGLLANSRTFVADTLFRGDGTFESLLTAPHGESRHGLLMQRSVMATLAHHETSDAVGRGKFIREVLLCEALPPPPPDVDAVPPPNDGDTTARDRLARHSFDPSCASCHQYMDPLGLPFEVFDAAGAYRTDENGSPIDTSGALYPLDGTDPIPFADAAELVAHLGSSEQVQRCFVQRFTQFAVGIAPDACTAERLFERFSETGGDVRELVVEMVRSEAFVTRRMEVSR